MKLSFSYLFLFYILAHSTSLAQKTSISTSAPTNWQVSAIMSNNNGASDGGSSLFENSIIYVDAKHAIESIQYSKNEFGLAMIDHNGVSTWQVKTDGYILFTTKFNNNIIAFYTKEWTKPGDYEIIKTIHATIVDPSTGKTITDKIIYENKSGKYIDPKILMSPGKSWLTMMIRYSNFNGKGFFTNYVDKLNETTGLDLLTINEDLTVKETKQLKSAAVNNSFLSCVITSEASLFIISYEGQELKFEKFIPGNESPVDHFAINADISIKSASPLLLTFDPSNPEQIYFTLKAKNNKELLNRLYAVNTHTKKIDIHEDILDKKYADDLADQDKDQKLKLRSNIKNLKNEVLRISDGNIITVRQIQYTYNSNLSRSSPDRHAGDEIIISVYNKLLQNVSNTVIKRTYESFSKTGIVTGAQIKNEKLYLFYNVISGFLKISGEYAVMDLSTKKIIDKKRYEKGSLQNFTNIEPGAIIHFSDGDLIPYYTSSPGFFGTHNFATTFQKMTF